MSTQPEETEGAPLDSSAYTLTREEIAEFRRLQKEAQERADHDRHALRTQVLERTGPTHHVHLADGSIVKLAGGHLATHHNGVPVTGAWEMSPDEQAAARAEELAALGI